MMDGCGDVRAHDKAPLAPAPAGTQPQARPHTHADVAARESEPCTCLSTPLCLRIDRSLIEYARACGFACALHGCEHARARAELGTRA